MASYAQVTRTIKLPDSLRTARFERAPELGPRVLFFSGGSALRPLSRVLKRYTHNSVHLITPFDSGGSSAVLRKAFDMLSIGDLRNRLVALADESVRGNPEIYRLFCYRLPLAASDDELLVELGQMVSGTHPLVSEVPQPMRHIIRRNLRFLADHAPSELELRGANIGNLMLTGGYLAQDRDVESTLFLFSKLLEVRGVVRPVADTQCHLAVTLADGTRVVGQHLLTGKEVAPLGQRIGEIFLVRSLEDPTPTEVDVEDKVLRLIRRADLVVYSIGSFYSSVLANLLPRGIGRTIARTRVPKVYVPNCAPDPEQMGMTVADCVDSIVSTVRADAGAEVPTSAILDLVLIDSRAEYAAALDPEALLARGVQVVDVPIMELQSGVAKVEPQLLAEVLLSLC